MIRFETLCYLQNHKSGCSFVETFLRSCCTEAVTEYSKHAALTSWDQRLFYFTNVREPTAQYLSLFAYGLDGKGEVFERLSAGGWGHLYRPSMDGFEQWLTFVLEPKNAELISKNYPVSIAARFGLMSWRFLRLACFGLEASVLEQNRVDVTDAEIKDRLILHAVLKQENLSEGLARLVEGPLRPAISNQAEALRWLRQAPRINASTPAHFSHGLGTALSEQVQRREQLLYEQFYLESCTTLASQPPSKLFYPADQGVFWKAQT